MAQVLVLAMYVRAIRLPVEYIPLAKGDSRSYLLLESLYDVCLAALVIVGFRQWGVFGAGAGVAAAGIFSFVFVYVYARFHYGYRQSSSVLRCAAVQLSIGFFVFLCVRSDSSWLRWGLAAALCVVSMMVSFRVLKSKTGLWNVLISRLKNKFIRHAKD